MTKQNDWHTKILLIDDDEGLLRLVTMTLENYGFHIETAPNGIIGLERFMVSQADLVILDVMMPGMDGREVCQKLREHSNVPILFLTARNQVQDRIEGLTLGADDYLVKPFDVKELQARIESLLRRARMLNPEHPKMLRFSNGALIINCNTQQIFVNNTLTHLTPTEYDLLLYMAEHAGRILTVETLYNAVWSYKSDADPQTVRWYIWRLRKKIEPDPDNPHFILTEQGVGYRFNAL